MERWYCLVVARLSNQDLLVCFLIGRHQNAPIMLLIVTVFESNCCLSAVDKIAQNKVIFSG